MMKPVNGLIFIAPDVPPEKTIQGVYLPANTKKQTMGIVRLSNSKLCKPGDHVAFGRYIPASHSDDLIVIDERSLISVDDGTEVPFAFPGESAAALATG